ncbi:hypothetical protein [Methanobacterium spitsbergense]|uniref:Uncharacterized protein n=1 Tax=Methanobacterium spitsbergense TaxID=2874285 RepID=A0A8T5V0M4_9EURY|nr:hypothetical protein [Methanobacterium spitsbergense]MBZ2167000.1 hypothetical protein [Methanobacterium spitsbergense]
MKECNDCKHLSGMVAIDELTLDVLITKAVNNNNQTNTSDKPTFEPNENFGEGTPTKDELDYRGDLTGYLETIYDKTVKFLLDKETLPEDKIKTIDIFITSFIKEAQGRVEPLIKDRYQEGYDGMNSTLKGYDVKPPKQKSKQPRLDSILRQQLMNIEDIGLVLRGRIRQIFNMDDINSYYASITQSSAKTKAVTIPSTWTQCMKDASKDHPEMTEIELREYCENLGSANSAFNDSQNRLDILGMFGWVESQKTGWLEAGLFAAATLTLAIDVDWVTVGDDSVCEYCQDNEDNNPWSITNIPEEHYGGRCKLVVAGVEFDA